MSLTLLTTSSSDDDAYYDRVASLLARMEVGQSISITRIVKPENQKLFITCFKLFAGLSATGPYWFDWDDEMMIITKYERFW